MIPPHEERTPPMTPQLALRVAIVGTCALVMFAIIFFRLWYLQVLSGSKYVSEAAVNFVRSVPVQAPRGEILDRSGNVMVGSRPVPVVDISPANLPVPVSLADGNVLHQPRADFVLYRKLARVLSVSTKPQPCRIQLIESGNILVYHRRLAYIPCLVAQGVSQVSYADVTVKTDVDTAVQGYLLERQRQFPGVVMQQASLRHYPLGTTAAQLFGTVGPITVPETHDPRFKGVPQTDTVGQAGLEFEYNQYLQGRDGSEKVTVNAQGQVEKTIPGRSPIAGENLKLSIDTHLQQVGQQALATSIADNPGADGGAFVALDPTNGQVLAMGSNPTFNPGVFTHPITQSRYDAMFGASSGSPLVNRAIQSAGPTGSTFKPITATAALESGDWAPDQIWDDTGQFCFPHTTDCLHNSGNASYGAVGLVQAIQFSVDTFFYNLGLVTNVDPATHPNGGPLQQWAKLYGIGRSTGIDLPGAVAGTRPSPAWRAARNRLESQCEHATGQFKGHPKHPASQGGCGIADGTPWTEGDNVNMAVGQGDVQVSPLQLAVAYSALANGGTIITPHVGMDVESSTGALMRKIDPAPRRHLNINPVYLDEIRTGLRDAASQPGGTSDDVMGKFPQQVYGKTGTAQYIANGVENDYAWYACFVPPTATSKPITIVVTVEKGGFGDVAAAPVARQMLSQWFYGKPGQFVKGQSTTL